MKTIIANWKMNGSRETSSNLISKIISAEQVIGFSERKVVICPPFPLLDAVRELLGNSSIKLGAQDCSMHASGAFTGEVSAEMLADIGCSYVILGHSERRSWHGETNELIAKKATMALEHQLIPVICVGESLIDRETGSVFETLEKQLDGSIPKQKTGSVIIAYEPIWAIGTGRTATQQQIDEVHEFITRKTGLNVVYGGSVNDSNSKDIIASSYVSGVLVGGASLKPESFINIIAS